MKTIGKRLLSLLLVVCLVMGTLAGGAFSALAADNEYLMETMPNASSGESAVIIHRNIVDETNKIVSMDMYLYNISGSTVALNVHWDPAILQPVNAEDHAVIASSAGGSARRGMVAGFEYYNSDEGADVSIIDSTTGLLIPQKQVVTFGEANTAFYTLLLSTANKGFFEGMSEGNAYKANTEGLGLGVIRFFFKVADGKKLTDVTPAAFYPTPGAEGSGCDMSGISAGAGTQETKTKTYYFDNFPVPAKAPTGVSISANPTETTSGENVTLTVNGTSPDGGTLQYAYTTGETAPTAEEMAALTFQNGQTFTVQAVDSSTKYWGVVKNTVTDGGSAYAASAASVSLTVNVKVQSVNVALAAPVAGEAPGTVEGTADYTVKSITWSPTLTGGKFASEQAYTATIVLQPTALHTFVAPVTATVNGKSATATVNADKTLTVEVTYDETGKTAEDIATELQAAVDGIEEWGLSQGELGTGDNFEVNNDAVAAAVKTVVDSALSGNTDAASANITVSANVTKAPVKGTLEGESANPTGEDGTASFTVTIVVGSVTKTVEKTGVAIKALPAVQNNVT